MKGTQQTNAAAASASAAAGIIDFSMETISTHYYSPSTTEDASNEILTVENNQKTISERDRQSRSRNDDDEKERGESE